MTAKEMFKKLGFNQIENDNYIISYRHNKSDGFIYFYLISKTIEITFDINLELLQAINKQVEELGWNEN